MQTPTAWVARSEGRVGWRKAEAHLFPVVDDDDFAVLVVDGHRALVAFTCRHTWQGAHEKKHMAEIKRGSTQWRVKCQPEKCSWADRDTLKTHAVSCGCKMVIPGICFGFFFLTYLLLTYSKRNTEPAPALPARPVNTSSYLGAIKGLFFKCVNIGIDFKRSVFTFWIHCILKIWVSVKGDYVNMWSWGKSNLLTPSSDSLC